MTLRLLVDGPLDGRENMARDEALLASAGEAAGAPTLRLYQWRTPTISLGYFQPYAEIATLATQLRSLAVVRRLSGGGAILHDLELTYSLALPIDHALLSGGPNRLYELAHDAVIATIARLGATAQRCGVSDDSGAARGPFFCFARRHCYDVLVGGEKLAGSAQRRTRRGVLQHGSIVLGNRFPEQPTATVARAFEEAVAMVRESFPVDFASATRMALSPGEWTAEELASAERLCAKYSSDEWAKRC